MITLRAGEEREAMNTLILEKANVARLRDLLEKETDPLVQKFIRYQLGTARLRHDIAECGVIAPERIEQVEPKTYKRVKIVVIVVSIAVILAIVLFAGSGCAHTINGVGQDIVVWSSPYIHQER